MLPHSRSILGDVDCHKECGRAYSQLAGTYKDGNELPAHEVLEDAQLLQVEWLAELVFVQVWSFRTVTPQRCDTHVLLCHLSSAT